MEYGVVSGGVRIELQVYNSEKSLQPLMKASLVRLICLLYLVQLMMKTLIYNFPVVSPCNGMYQD